MVLDIQVFDLIGERLDVDCVCTDPEDVLTRKPPEHPQERHVGVNEDVLGVEQVPELRSRNPSFITPQMLTHATDSIRVCFRSKLPG